MEWLIYENSDDATKVFVGVLLIVAIAFVIVINVYYWVSDKIKKYKQNKK